MRSLAAGIRAVRALLFIKLLRQRMMDGPLCLYFVSSSSEESVTIYVHDADKGKRIKRIKKKKKKKKNKKKISHG